MSEPNEDLISVSIHGGFPFVGKPSFTFDAAQAPEFTLRFSRLGVSYYSTAEADLCVIVDENPGALTPKQTGALIVMWVWASDCACWREQNPSLGTPVHRYDKLMRKRERRPVAWQAPAGGPTASGPA